MGFVLALVLSLVLGGLTACQRTSLGGGSEKPEVSITLVSFAVTRAAHDGIIPKFAAQWKASHHQTVRVKRSYGGSGAQARAVIDGLDADVVHLALALDTKRIQKEGLIEPGWEQEFPHQSVVSQSVVALVTRPGNPKGIQSWTDLARPGIQVITADPKTSGVARWNFLALWNAAVRSETKDAKAVDAKAVDAKAVGAEAVDAKATEFVTQVYKNAPILTKDARQAADAFFKQGQGDALINYENEVLLARQKGIPLEYSVPEPNISIDNPIAIVDKNVDKHGNREVAEAFVRFLFTPEAQAEFVKVGFRAVNPGVTGGAASNSPTKPAQATEKTLGTVQDFGGWDVVQKRFFADGALFDQMRGKR